MTNVLSVPDLDLQLTPSGEVTKQIGEALPVSCTISSSRNATVLWIKVSNLTASHLSECSPLHITAAASVLWKEVIHWAF